MELSQIVNHIKNISGSGNDFIEYYVTLDISCSERYHNKLIDELNQIKSKNSIATLEYEGNMFYETETFSVEFGLYTTHDSSNYLEYKINKIIGEYTNVLEKYYHKVNIELADLDKEFLGLEDIAELVNADNINDFLENIKDEIKFNKK